MNRNEEPGTRQSSRARSIKMELNSPSVRFGSAGSAITEKTVSFSTSQSPSTDGRQTRSVGASHREPTNERITGGADRRGRCRGRGHNRGRSVVTFGQTTYSQPGWIVDWPVSDQDSSSTSFVGRDHMDRVCVPEQQVILKQINEHHRQHPVINGAPTLESSPAVKLMNNGMLSTFSPPESQDNTGPEEAVASSHVAQFGIVTTSDSIDQLESYSMPATGAHKTDSTATFRKPVKRESVGYNSLPARPSRASSPIPSRRASVAALTAAYSNRQTLSAAAATAINRSQGSTSRNSKFSQTRGYGSRQRLQLTSPFACDSFEPHQCPSSNMTGNGSACVDLCYRRHYDEAAYLPYLWRVKDGDKWIPLSSINVDIERAYCKPENSSFSSAIEIKLDDGKMIEKFKLNFELMTSNIGPVQRLSTPSYVKQRDKNDATLWIWYYCVKDQYIPYEVDGQPFQDVVESKYLVDPTQLISFQMDGAEQIINFSTMTHHLNSMTTNKTMPCLVKRRPRFNGDGTSVPEIGYHYHQLQMPKLSDVEQKWSPMNTDKRRNGPKADLIPLTSIPMYIYEHLRKSAIISHCRIHTIYRLQNIETQAAFMRKKAVMVESMPPDSVKQLTLFHQVGSWSEVLVIANQNFPHYSVPYDVGIDRRGVVLKVSLDDELIRISPLPRYRERRNRMYVVVSSVLVGRIVKAERRNSSTNGNTTSDIQSDGDISHSPDSYVDDINTPTEYVIFESSQILPKHVISYESSETPPNMSMLEYCVIV